MRNKYLLPVSILLFIVGVEFFPYLLGDFPIVVYDYLDKTFPWKHLGAAPFFPDESFNKFIEHEFLGQNNLPNLHLGGIFYMTLPPKIAYILTHIFCKLIAFVGMFLLLREILGKRYGSFYLASACAGLHAALPLFWDQNNFFTDATLPLTLWAFLCATRRGINIPVFLVLAIVPFFISYHFATLFVVFYLIAYMCWQKKIDKNLAYAIGVSLFFFLVSHYDYILSAMHWNGFVSYREIWADKSMDNSIVQYFKDVLRNFFETNYHVGTFHKYLVLPVCLAALLLGSKSQTTKLLRLGICLICANCVLSQIPEHFSFARDVLSYIPGLGLATFRLYYLNQVLWYVCFCLSLYQIYAMRRLDKNMKGRLVFACFTIQFLIVFYGHSMIYKTAYKNREVVRPTTFDRFFAEEQFKRVRELIGRDPNEYRIASIGLHPSVAAFNGMAGVDFYSTSYDIEHHKQMKQVLSSEIERNKDFFRFFTEWGSKCYLIIGPDNKDHVKFLWTLFYLAPEAFEAPITLDLNLDTLKTMGVSYLVSRMQLEFSGKKPRLLGIVEKKLNEESDYAKLYIYKI